MIFTDPYHKTNLFVVTISRTMSNPTFNDFDLLVDKHTREIFSYLWRMLWDHEDAEDALQETFLRAFRGYPALRDHTNLRAWLYKIATNFAYTHLKRRARHDSQVTELLEIHGDEHFAGRDLIHMILDAIQNLPQKQGAALILRNYQGLTYAEIGEALHCSAEAARANYYQGLKKLRNQFAQVEK